MMTETERKAPHPEHVSVFRTLETQEAASNDSYVNVAKSLRDVPLDVPKTMVLQRLYLNRTNELVAVLGKPLIPVC